MKRQKHLVIMFCLLIGGGLASNDASAQLGGGGFSESLNEDFYVSPSLFYYSGLRSKSTREEKTFLAYDLKVGYQVYPNIFLGLIYQGDESTIKNSGYASETLNNSSKSSRASYGASLGYITPSLHFMFSYYIESKWKLNTTTSAGVGRFDYSGNGMQFDIGYKIPLGKVVFGPQISYKLYSYSKVSIDGGQSASASPKLEESNLEPSLVLYYFF